MERLVKSVCRITVISLLLSVIWHSSVLAAVMPQVKALGRIEHTFSAPTKIAVDNNGTIYVADPRQNVVFKLDKYGQEKAKFTAAKVLGTGLAVSPDGASVYVSSGKAVTVLSGSDGTVQRYLGAGEGEFGEAGDIDLDGQGFIYVADNSTRFVKVYDPATGKFLYKFGGPGKTNGLFWVIRGIAVNKATSEIYVVDPSSGTGSARIQVFSLSGTYKSVLAYTKFGTPYLAFPSGIALDDAGRGYFADSFYSDVRVMSMPTTYVGKIGVEGYEIGALLRPYDVAYDSSTKRLLVACDGARIDVFGIDGGENPVKANVAPGVPVAVAPASDQEVDTATPQLVWNNASDADGDVLTYNVKVMDAAGAVVASATKVVAGAATSTVSVAGTLIENTRYTWSVQADDGEELSEWSAPASFVVNAVQEAPAASTLTAPVADALLDGKSVFGWGASADPDPFDSVVAYRIEISATADFTAPLLGEDVAEFSQVLGAMANYDKLVDGESYFWRVSAIDNHGLLSAAGEVRSFVYDTTLLKITANLPGAKVFFGGNIAYSGKFVGEAPLELRDVAAGSFSVVVERAGFEPWFGQVTIADKANVELYAVQQAAVAPADIKARPLSAGGAKIVVGADAMPVVVDFNNDGYLDMFVADSAGVLKYYAGLPGELTFDVASTFALTLPAGSMPLVLDWNNDGRKDLLAGTGAGNVLLFLNEATDDAPAFAEGVHVMVDGLPLTVGAGASPVVYDVNNDGKKDLLVGSASGSVFKFLNVGTDEAPVLAVGGELIGKLSTNAVPFMTDWNADGYKDLLLATDQHLYVCLQLADGSFAPRTVLTVADDLVGKKGKSTSGSGYLGDKLHIFALNADGKKGKDLIIGNAAGEVRFAASFGKKPVAAYRGAVSDKVSQVAELASEQAVELLPAIGEVDALILAENYAQAQEKAVATAALAPQGSQVALLLNELAGILNIK